ncbi:phosphonate degradation HD-domain oxygenase [Streptosporangium sp. NPDC000396]|uniref:2-trimethylaminoethylphosphonate dioxygenase n=1 Tax=Streptosporangium sp. NPDC000396 TaxID=3366185 RepID=UPI0036AA311C
MISDFPAVWLRDNCPCPECRDPRNGQKLFGITDLDPRIHIVEADGLSVTFSDGHTSRFDPAWLAAHTLDGTVPDDRTEDAKELWATVTPPEGNWPRFLADPHHRQECLEAVFRTGFVLLREVPAEPGAVLEVAGAFGYVRETNYGRLFDVRVEATPVNLAFTGLPITPHTDNPYRDPVPTVQLLHCLSNAVDGGESGLVDGFHAASLLRAENPGAFELLTRTPVTFRYGDAGTELTASRPMIGVDPLGRIREVRFNNRSLQPVRLPYERTEAFYAAYRAFAEILYRPELQVNFRLGPSDCVIFDNTRILHARTGFSDTGDRHLQGCYADLDGFAGNLAVLRRRNAVVERLRALFEGPGADDYLGEEVTQAAHMLQAAACAREAGAAPGLVAASLLHDVGHFTGEITGHDLMGGTDNRHSHVGADWLGQWFGPEMTEPIRLHVAAKRYLCAVDGSYHDLLSEASRYTLGVQGGPMSPREVAEFEAEPYAQDAVRLRRWDDEAKDPGREVPPFTDYAALLHSLIR